MEKFGMDPAGFHVTVKSEFMFQCEQQPSKANIQGNFVTFSAEYSTG
jgi:hypothetical protein